MTTDELLDLVATLVRVGGEELTVDDLPPVAGDTDHDRRVAAVVDYQRADTIYTAAKLLRDVAAERAAEVLDGRGVDLGPTRWEVRRSRRYKLHDLDRVLAVVPADAVPQVWRLSGDNLRRRTLAALLDSIGANVTADRLLAEAGEWVDGPARLTAIPIEVLER